MALVNLHILDLRLAAAGREASELQIALIKLAWWRDALADLPGRSNAGEPLLASLAQVDVAGWPSCLVALAEAHMDMVEEQPEGAASRGAALFGAAAQLLAPERDKESIEKIGAAWGRGRRPEMEQAVPRFFRPVTALARIYGKTPRSPTRQQLSIVAHMLTGRF